MNNALMFSKASDEWSTPREFFESLDREFHFRVDAAATPENTQCVRWFGRPMTASDGDALYGSWVADEGPFWLNPPYSKCREFISKAAAEACNGCTVVCLVPSRTDTRWWHEHVWDAETNQPRAGVEVRFIKGRLKFGGCNNAAPFPSVVIVFRPPS